MKNTIKGEWRSQRVWLDGLEITPVKSQKIINHSPDGFNWSYGGSGPAQLALAVLMEIRPKDKETAVKLHQNFKWEIIAALPAGDFEIELDIEQWIERTLS